MRLSAACKPQTITKRFFQDQTFKFLIVYINMTKKDGDLSAKRRAEDANYLVNGVICLSVRACVDRSFPLVSQSRPSQVITLH